MQPHKPQCPDCDAEVRIERRDFLKVVSATAVGASLPLWATPKVQAAPKPSSAAETAVKALYDSLTDKQREDVCFDWDFKTDNRGLLRTYVSNNWQITGPHVRSDYYTKQQQTIIHDIFKGLISPKWYDRMVKHLKDDTDGAEWGAEQSIALFGKPGGDKFEFVMTGRHMTLRADGNTENHVAFGGPIFYGHQATQVKGLLEKPGHPGNVFWHQAEMANKVYKMLDPKLQARTLLDKSPREREVGFNREKKFPGLPVAEMPDEVKKELQKVLLALVEPFRTEDQEEALAALQKRGGLAGCSLAFYKDEDHGSDGLWDNWRLEGPAFVWYFRGNPHVHVWVNIADDPSVALNA